MHNETSPAAGSDKKRIDFVLVGIVVASLAIVLYLVLKPSRAPGVRPQTTPSLSRGVMVQPIPATNLSGLREVIDYKKYETPTVIYVVKPNCAWCERNTKNINAIVSLKADVFHFVGVSLASEGLADYLKAHQMNFDFYTDPAPESVQMLGLGATPQTIVISRDGSVLQNWVGAFGPDSQPQVERFFGVQLPGLEMN